MSVALNVLRCLCVSVACGFQTDYYEFSADSAKTARRSVESQYTVFS
jgi:hypothetical protein